PFAPALTSSLIVTPQAGGTFVQAVDEDADTLNPLLTLNRTSQAVAGKLLPTLLGQDAHSGAITATELAERWTISADGRVYTFTLRANIFWSDGQPVAARDVQFTYAAIGDETVQSPLQGSVEQIEKIETPDDYTVVITLHSANCAMLYALRHPLLPSHRYAADFSDLRTNELNETPTVSAGPFRFVSRIPGEAIRLERNPSYWKGTPRLAGWVYGVVPDPEERLALLAAGEVDGAPLDPAQITRTVALAGVRSYEYQADTFSFIALNLADPANPQPGRDAANAPIVQAPHPILGDAGVRRALALSIDTGAMIEEVYAGKGFALASDVLPKVTWAYAANLQPYTVDQAEANTLLTAADWQDADGDGVREKAGVALQLNLFTNSDNPQRIRMGELVQQQLAQTGFDVRFQPLAFEELTSALLEQTYDMALIGWDGMSADPGNNAFWHSREDRPGVGFNFTSYQNAAVDQWLDGAQAAPGCNINVRATLYRLVQAQIHADLPYIFLSGRTATWAYRDQWQGIQPGMWQFDENVQDWREK
ncbi:MAG: ABC transporter substrate-binding protein, partial [Chloroflexota bacterium]|nr:ABC transporter substrate-binding protein [Chloroflexota bacterium]